MVATRIGRLAVGQTIVLHAAAEKRNLSDRNTMSRNAAKRCSRSCQRSAQRVAVQVSQRRPPNNGMKLRNRLGAAFGVTLPFGEHRGFRSYPCVRSHPFCRGSAKILGLPGK